MAVFAHQRASLDNVLTPFVNDVATDSPVDTGTGRERIHSGALC